MCKVSTGAGETKPEGLQFLSDTKPIALHILHFWRNSTGKVSTSERIVQLKIIGGG